MPETATDPLILAAEQADAEAAAAEAEALAAQASATAARARARAAELRRAAGERSPESEAAVPVGSADPASTEESVEAATVDRAATGSGDAPEGATATDSAPDLEAGEDPGPDTDGATSSVSFGKGSDKEGAGDTRASADADSGGDPATGVRKPAAKGLRSVADRLAVAGRRVKPGRVRRPGRRGVARALVAVIVLFSLVAGGYSVWNHYRITADQAREDEFLNAAREGVIALTTLDSGRAADDVKRVLDHSTGAFRTDFQTRSEDFTKVVEQSAVATKGEITGAAVESMTDESAVVLVSAVSRVTNAAGAQQEPRVWRLSVTVTREGSDLKMSKVEFVP